MTVLITGANGLLGSSFKKSYTDNENIKCIERKDIDLTNHHELRLLLEKTAPRTIIHTAAWTDVEGCELEPKKCYKINTLATKDITRYCKRNNTYLVFISSTGIYGSGQKTPFTEDSEPHPTTIHHCSKHDAEKIITRNLKKYLIIRTGWLFGGNKNHKKNFVYHRYQESLHLNEIFCEPTQVGCPTYTVDLVNQVKLLMTKNKVGIYNCVNEGRATRLQYVQKILELFNSNIIIRKASKNYFNRKAKVSNNESVFNQKLKKEGICIMPSWENSLSLYIKGYINGPDNCEH